MVTRQCLKFADSCGDDSGILSFLDSMSAVLRRSLCGVDWNLRDTAVEFIDGTFLIGLCSLLCSMFVAVVTVSTGPGPVRSNALLRSRNIFWTGLCCICLFYIDHTSHQPQKKKLIDVTVSTA